jgi:hypothetical protein
MHDLCFLYFQNWPDVVTHRCNLSPPKSEAGGSKVQGQTGLHIKTVSGGWGKKGGGGGKGGVMTQSLYAHMNKGN